jgi:hypothetical protein
MDKAELRRSDRAQRGPPGRGLEKGRGGWNLDRLDVLDRMAAAVSVPELVEEIAQHGEPHSECSMPG